MKTIAAPEVRLVGGDLKVAFRQPLWKHPIKPFRILLIPEGADPVIRIAAQQCLAATVDLNPRVEPHIQGVVQIHIGQDGGAYTSYKVANFLVEFSTSIPRTQLRPSYGDGFLGAPLQSRRPLQNPAPQEQGGER